METPAGGELTPIYWTLPSIGGLIMAVGKLTEKEKLKVVKQYLTGLFSYADLSRQIGVDKRAIRLWVALYKRHGRKALAPRKSCVVYDLSFKMNVINYHRRTQSSYFKTAVEFNLASPSTVQRWEEQVLFKDVEAFLKPKKGRPPMINKKPEDMNQKELQDELKYLRMENAYLKKLEALVQEKKTLQKQTGQKRSKN